ncbi:hypothetical protein CC1G_03789 [Coprinopsis cinerea okayama7|uniref:Mitochondrial cytochrome c oxidase assembly factor n=1 Tax=Coprinopsis cinerea (strain Okayama-7 / 130 / ATCC MYA-4618 / FGSC 9003) TaxID=240176 RepID=A8NGQ5_COPC7|nr:hypothetical protein CC1G_03789 [Coprinopsis cinerea okayama7\|eukprot:XP_001833572.1 hypothetical protein CC1G_03789 [Coprinopsis cinerea okayama7\
MGGPNLEIFKFSLYLFVPIAALVHFGDPDWYREHVVPYRLKLFPPPDRTVHRLPTEQSAIREELERIKAERLAKRAARQAAAAQENQDS